MGKKAREKRERRSTARQGSATVADLVGDKVSGYATAYVDLLGMGQQLLKMDSVVRSNDDEKRQQYVADTLLPIAYFRHHFKLFFEKFYSREAAMPPGPLNAQSRAIWQSYTAGNPPLVTVFSDCVAISVPLDYDNRMTMFRSIYALLMAIAGTSAQLAFAKGVFVRGGIALGYGCVMRDGGRDAEVLGSGIAKAYLLERRADSPRVLLSAELLGLLRGIPDGLAHDPTFPVDQALRDQCLGQLRTDEGQAFIDFLANPEVAEVLGGPAKLLDGVASHAHRNKAAALAGEYDEVKAEHIAKKYDWVLQYIEDVRARVCGSSASP